MNSSRTPEPNRERFIQIMKQQRNAAGFKKILLNSWSCLFDLYKFSCSKRDSHHSHLLFCSILTQVQRFFSFHTFDNDILLNQGSFFHLSEYSISKGPTFLFLFEFEMLSRNCMNEGQVSPIFFPNLPLVRPPGEWEGLIYTCSVLTSVKCTQKKEHRHRTALPPGSNRRPTQTDHDYSGLKSGVSTSKGWVECIQYFV